MPHPARLGGLAAPLLALLAALAPAAPAQTTVTRTYTYGDPTHLQVTRVVETTSDGVTRTTETAYAHKQPGMTGMAALNMLAQPYAVTVLEGTDVESKTWATYTASGAYWRPYEEWAWRGNGDGVADDPNAPGTPGDAETFFTARATAYDAAGRPTSVTDGRGGVTTYAYGASNAGPDLTRITRPTANGVVHTTDYAYDGRRRLTSVTDANGAQTAYRYDGFGRLTGVRLPETPTSLCTTPTAECTTTYAYTYGTNGAPSSVRQRDYAAPGVYAETVTFLDGRGRPVQVHARDQRTDGVWGYRVAATTYDALGRPARQYLPYWKAGAAAAYDAQFAQSAAAFYNGSTTHNGVAVPNANSRPFAEATYLADPTGRPATAVGEGTTVAATTAYALGLFDAKTYAYVEATDETGRKARTYSDALGRAVASVAGYGAPEAATTKSAYDVLGRVTQVTAPEDQGTTYTYDPLGRLVKTESPDWGTTSASGFALHKYDQAGNARFRQDPNEAAAGRALYTEYDALGRPTETGQGAVSWSTLTGWNATPSALRAQANVLSATAYDRYPVYTSHPWVIFFELLDQPDPTDPLSATSVSNPVDRPTGVVSKSGSGAEAGWQAELYSYDKDGRVKDKWVYTTTTSGTATTSNTLRARYTYTYDWQGRVLTETRRVGANVFYQWYDYDGAGQLTKVFASTSATKPATPDVTYTYDARGARSSYQYAGNPLVKVTYTARGWLDGIGDVASAAFPFSERRAYAANGLVTTVEVYNKGVADANKRARFAMTGSPDYDALGRLKSANYSPWTGSGYGSSSAYDLSAITYDDNGNLRALRRNRASGSTIDNLTYTYASGKNWLTRVTDAVAATTEPWDAETGDFTYDANGNALTAAPAGLPPLANNAASMAYDWRNLPVSMAKGGVTSTYRYAASGDRTWRKVGSSTAEYVALDGSVTVGVFSATGALKEWNVLAGGAPIGRQPATGARLYYHADALGSVRSVTNNAGAVVEARDYDPWGLALSGRQSGSGTREGFTGHEYDGETGLNYAGARYYMPALGRFTSTDPHAVSYPGWSPYHYGANNPLGVTDPTGRDWYSQIDGDGWTQYKWFEGSDKRDDGWGHVGATHSYQDGQGQTVNLLDSGEGKWEFAEAGSTDDTEAAEMPVLAAFAQWQANPEGAAQGLSVLGGGLTGAGAGAGAIAREQQAKAARLTGRASGEAAGNARFARNFSRGAGVIGLAITGAVVYEAHSRGDTQAVYGAVGSAAFGIAGGIIGSSLGPLGTAAGAAVGAFAGQAIGEGVYDLRQWVQDQRQ